MRRFPRILLTAGLVTSIALSVITPARSADKKDLVDTAVEAGSFKTLATALQSAGLVDALKGPGPFTVFAPTDDAFAKLPAGTVEDLLKPKNKQALVGILTYHVVPGRVTAEQVEELSNAETLNGQRVAIQASQKTVRIDDAKVTTADIMCSNGIIHVIDRVILPNSDAIPATAAKAKMFSTLLTAVKTAGLAETLSGQGPFTVFAPTDEAFAKLPKGTVESLLKPKNRDQLTAILKLHVVSGRVYSDAALETGEAKSLQGETLQITVSKKGAEVNGAKIVKTDIDAANGVIHVIDSVLLPGNRRAVNAADARKMIEKAIHEGATFYNDGRHSACLERYETTARQIVKHADTDMPSSAVMSLKSALAGTQHSQCVTTNAWTLRRGLDMAYYHLRDSAH